MNDQLLKASLDQVLLSLGAFEDGDETKAQTCALLANTLATIALPSAASMVLERGNARFRSPVGPGDGREAVIAEWVNDIDVLSVKRAPESEPPPVPEPLTPPHMPGRRRAEARTEARQRIIER